MINNPDWHKTKVKSYFHQFSLDCMEEIAVCIESIDIEEMVYDTCLIVLELLIDKIEDEEFFEFAIENLHELLSYISTEILNIRIQRDNTCEMCLGWMDV